VQGRYEAARRDCERLSRSAPEIYVTICTAAIDSVTGKAANAYQSLQDALRTLPRVDDAAREWGETLLGEIAHRRNDKAAERHFRAALEASEKDLYLLGAYADWLLDQQRPADVIALLQNETRVDALLLRLALAQHALKHALTRVMRAAIPCTSAKMPASSYSFETMRTVRSLTHSPTGRCNASLRTCASWPKQRSRHATLLCFPR